MKPSARRQRRALQMATAADRRRRKFQAGGPIELRVAIMTRDRPDDLRRILADVLAWSMGLKTEIAIYDDASEDAWAVFDAALRVGAEVIRFPKPHGREDFWSLYNRILRDFRDHAGWGVVFPDDYRLCEDFFSRAFKLHEELPGPAGALNPMRDHRSGRNGWGGKPATETENLIVDHWVDCSQVARPAFYEAIGFEVRPGHSRHIGTGVGSQMSRRAAAAGLSMAHPKQSLVVHVGRTESVLHPEHRKEQPIQEVDFVDGDVLAEAFVSHELVIGHLATIPSREEQLPRVVDSVLGQVDELHVYLDGHSLEPACLDHPRIQVHLPRIPLLGDAGKFLGCEKKGYHLHFDDDLVYPTDYVARMIRHVERHDRCAVVSAHGARLPAQVNGNYYRERTTFSCLGDISEEIQVHVVGTGALAWHTDCELQLPPDPREVFPHRNMADIWLAIRLKKIGISAYVVPHKAGWLEALPGKGIYEETSGKEEHLVAALQEAGPW